jgi:16S rRNA (guanine527-N7)-methyltransferase
MKEKNLEKLTAEVFFEIANIPHHLQKKLLLYAELLKKWQKVINLVSPQSLENLWERHFFDCWQFFDFIPEKAKTLADFGSGAGLPGMVIALLWEGEVHLIESDQRKAAFLRELAFHLELTNVVFHVKRIEDISLKNIDVISARAFAPLKKIFFYAQTHIHEDSLLLLAKGKNYSSELTEAQTYWDFQYEKFFSKSKAESIILKIQNLKLKKDLI